MNCVVGIYSEECNKRFYSNLQIFYPWLALYWAIGIETGYRVSDLLRLRWMDVADDGIIRITERKTGKLRYARLSETTLELFKSEMAEITTSPEAQIWPYSRQQIWRWLRLAGRHTGLSCIVLAHIAHEKHMPGTHF